MSKVTSKRQVTVPKAIADEFGIRPGDETHWLASGGAIRILTGKPTEQSSDIEERLRRYDEAVARQRLRQRGRRLPAAAERRGRGWTREELYERGQPG